MVLVTEEIIKSIRNNILVAFISISCLLKLLLKYFVITSEINLTICFQ